MVALFALALLVAGEIGMIKVSDWKDQVISAALLIISLLLALSI